MTKPRSVLIGIAMIPVLIAAVLIASACSGSTAASSSTPTVTNITMSDPATCAATSGGLYAHVYVTVKDVEASTDANATSGFTDLTPSLAQKPMQIDLLGQANNQCLLAMLGSTTELQAGNYQQIRLILLDNNSPSLVANNQCGNASNCVVLGADNSVHTLNLSSEAQTGIKIPSGQIAGGQFTIAAGQTKDLNLDFNTCSSIVVEGNGQYRLKPVLHAGEIAATSTSINGTVVDKATSQPIAGKVMVALEQKDSNGVDRVMMAADADSSGHFVFCPVPAGTYDVVAVGLSSSNVAYAATVTTGVANGTAMGNIPLTAEGGLASTAQATIAGQVTTSTGTAGTAADVSLSALEQVAAGTGTITITVPLVQQESATLNVATASGASCAANTDCASYSLAVPADNPNVGGFAASGASYLQATGAASYTVEGQAAVPSSGGTSDCNPSIETTGSTAISVTAGATVQAAILSFTGCQ